MKTPRIKDFDPTQSVPELGSPLDNMPAIQPAVATEPFSHASDDHASMADAPPPGPSPEVRPPVVPSVRTPGRRSITRYALEFFQDQIESLRGFALEEKFRGEKGSMSQMVREAVDAYIAKRNRTDV